MITMLVDTCTGDRNVDDEKNTIVRSASSFKEPRDEILLYSFFSSFILWRFVCPDS
jgi:hypothetical protein